MDTNISGFPKIPKRNELRIVLKLKRIKDDIFFQLQGDVHYWCGCQSINEKLINRKASV